MLSVEIINDEYREGQKCDGCLKELKKGDFLIGDIESCCGGGCSRAVCEACITDAYNKIQELKGTRINSITCSNEDWSTVDLGQQIPRTSTYTDNENILNIRLPSLDSVELGFKYIFSNREEVVVHFPEVSSTLRIREYDGCIGLIVKEFEYAYISNEGLIKKKKKVWEKLFYEDKTNGGE